MQSNTERFREKLSFDTYDAVIIEEPTQRRYFTGFTSTDGTLVITQDRAFLCVDSRYIEAAKAKAKNCEVLLINGVKDFHKSLANDNNIKCAAVSGETTVSRFKALKTKFAVELIDCDECDSAFAETASIKTADEIEKIRRAQEITDLAFDYILGKIKPGKTDNEMALELEFFMRSHGADGLAFDTIFISGSRTSMPHGTPSEKVIEKGDLVTIDFGAKFDGYCSDMTRTVAVGSVDDEQKAVYEIVLRAQKNCLDNIKAGIFGYEADKLARDVINDAGYGEYFGHGTGHSLGLNIHESPSASPLCKSVLKAGQMMTVEPGIYLPGKFGVRIEDMVLLTDNGCENFTKSKKELIIL